MNREELYFDTVDLILEAYNEGKLEHSNSCGCFIGNIVAKRDKNLEKSVFSDEIFTPYWYDVIPFRMLGNRKPIRKKAYEQIEATGYTVEEVIALEEAFEGARHLEQRDEHGSPITQYEGMKAALNKLAEIHNTPSKESIEKLDKIQELVYN